MVRVLIKIIPSISLHFKDSLVHTPSHVGTVTCCETNPRLLLFFLLAVVSISQGTEHG